MTTQTARIIDSISVSLNAGGMNTINIVLAVVMFGVALGIRPKTFIEVFKNPDDPELLIKFGTGRIAQILPKIDHLLYRGKQYTGFGFLHDELTTDNQFIITNEFYSDVTKSEESVARVEVTQIQTILDAGLIGFLLQAFYYLAIYFWVLKPLPCSRSYLIVLVSISIFGVGGFGGLISHQSLLLLGLATGAILLAAKQENAQRETSNLPS